MNIINLVKKAAKEDLRSQYDLYNHFLPIMKKVALKIIKSEDDVKDPLNEGFRKFFEKIQNGFVYMSDEETERFLHKTVKNLCFKKYNELKKNKCIKDNESQETIEEEDDEIEVKYDYDYEFDTTYNDNDNGRVIRLVPYEERNEMGIDPEILRKLDELQVKAIISRLPGGCRKVFELTVLGFSHKEISVLLNISVGTSHSQLKYAREYLAEIINYKTVKNGTDK